MECSRFESLLDAYADDTLPFDDRQAVVDHLATCARCRATVANVGWLRDAISRVLSRQRVPEEVRDRLLTALSVAAESARDTQPPLDQPLITEHADAIDFCRKPESVAEPAHETIFAARCGDGRDEQDSKALGRRRRRKLWGVVPLAVAAAIAYSLFLRNHVAPPSTQTTGFAQINVTDRVLIAAQKRHVWCATNGLLGHHSPDLPSDLNALGPAMSKMLGLEVLTPDFRAHGFGFVGANRCRVAGVATAHLQYFSAKTNMLLSAFTVVRIAELTADQRAGAPPRPYFSCGAAGVNAIAWHAGNQTHIVCAALPPTMLIEMVEDVRSRAAFGDSHFEALAYIKCY